MKANELMIGDWILSGGKSMKVIRLTDKINMIDDNKTKWFAEEVHPIPLTAEILEKNSINYEVGFGGLFMINLTGLNCSIQFNIIQSVHELQHALRLCGLNELADNFKV